MPDKSGGISGAKRRGAAHISSLPSSSLQTLIKVSEKDEESVNTILEVIRLQMHAISSTSLPG